MLISSGARAFLLPERLLALLCACVVLPLAALSCPVLASLVCPAFWTSVCPSSHFPPAGSFNARARVAVATCFASELGRGALPAESGLVHATVDGDIAATRVKRLARERKGWGDQAEVCGCRFAICWLIGWKKGGVRTAASCASCQPKRVHPTTKWGKARMIRLTSASGMREGSKLSMHVRELQPRRRVVGLIWIGGLQPSYSGMVGFLMWAMCLMAKACGE